MAWLRKTPALEPLAVSMPGVRLGDRLLVVGCTDPGLAAALAVKAGLTGRACAVDEDPARLARAAQAMEQAGALVETTAAPYTALPYENGSFDVAVVRDVLPGASDRRAVLAEVLRVLRPGGRCVVIDTVSRGGFAGLFGGSAIDPSYVAAGGAPAALTAAGFAAVRALAERDRLAFAEGVRANA